jgi:hypothetical protein
MNQPQKLAERQRKARLQAYQKLRAWDIRADGEWQFFLHRNSYGVSRNLPYRISIYGYVLQKTGEKYRNIDAGTLYIGSARSMIAPSPDTINGARYQIDMAYNADIFGKTVHYKLQKNAEKPIFEGSIYIAEKIGFPHPNPKDLPYMSRKDGSVIWTADAKGKAKVGVEITYDNNKTGKTRTDFFATDDDGRLDFKDFVRPTDSIYTQISVALLRTNCILKRGRDGKKYKITVYSRCDGLFVFE